MEDSHPFVSKLVVPLRTAEEETRLKLEQLLEQACFERKELGRLLQMIADYKRSTRVLLTALRRLEGDLELVREAEHMLHFFREAETLIARLFRVLRRPMPYSRFSGPSRVASVLVRRTGGLG